MCQSGICHPLATPCYPPVTPFCALVFFCDVTEKLNHLNLQLQSKGKTIIDTISILKSFKGKVNPLAMQLKRHDLKHYPNLADESKNKKDLSYNKYADIITLLLKEFLI